MTTYNELKDRYIDTPYINGILEGLEDDGYDATQAEEIIMDGCFNIYENCVDMSDVAYEIATMDGWLDGPWSTYFDFEKYGRDLEIEGTYYKVGDTVYAEIFY